MDRLSPNRRTRLKPVHARSRSRQGESGGRRRPPAVSGGWLACARWPEANPSRSWPGPRTAPRHWSLVSPTPARRRVARLPDAGMDGRKSGPRSSRNGSADTGAPRVRPMTMPPSSTTHFSRGGRLRAGRSRRARRFSTRGSRIAPRGRDVVSPRCVRTGRRDPQRAWNRRDPR